MREFQHKRKIKKILYSRFSLAALLLLTLFLGKAVYGVYLKERESHAELLLAEQELAGLEARKAMLETRIAGLQTPQGIEAEIREQFQVSKPGERMVVIVEDEEAEAPEVSQKQSLISRFFDIFR